MLSWMYFYIFLSFSIEVLFFSLFSSLNWFQVHEIMKQRDFEMLISQMAECTVLGADEQRVLLSFLSLILDGGKPCWLALKFQFLRKITSFKNKPLRPARLKIFNSKEAWAPKIHQPNWCFLHWCFTTKRWQFFYKPNTPGQPRKTAWAHVLSCKAAGQDRGGHGLSRPRRTLELSMAIWWSKMTDICWKPAFWIESTAMCFIFFHRNCGKKLRMAFYTPTKPQKLNSWPAPVPGNVLGPSSRQIVENPGRYVKKGWVVATQPTCGCDWYHLQKWWVKNLGFPSETNTGHFRCKTEVKSLGYSNSLKSRLEQNPKKIGVENWNRIGAVLSRNFQWDGTAPLFDCSNGGQSQGLPTDSHAVCDLTRSMWHPQKIKGPDNPTCEVLRRSA